MSILGLAFKPNTDAIRDAPALKLIRMLLEKGASVRAYDPEAMSNAKQLFTHGVKHCDSIQEAISDCDCVLILTEWGEFREESLYRGKTVIDGRRVLDPQKARSICYYQGICW